MFYSLLSQGEAPLINNTNWKHGLLKSSQCSTNVALKRWKKTKNSVVYNPRLRAPKMPEHGQTDLLQFCTKSDKKKKDMKMLVWFLVYLSFCIWCTIATSLSVKTVQVWEPRAFSSPKVKCKLKWLLFWCADKHCNKLLSRVTFCDGPS